MSKQDASLGSNLLASTSLPQGLGQESMDMDALTKSFLEGLQAILTAFFDLANQDGNIDNPQFDGVRKLAEDSFNKGSIPSETYRAAPDNYDLSGLDSDSLPRVDGETFDLAFDHIVKAEGGYANHPSDPGGETFMGIARTYNPDIWAEWDRQGITAQDFKSGNVPESVIDDVREVYKDRYWDKVDGIENMTEAQAIVAFDAAVNHGVGTANEMVAEAGLSTSAMLEWRSDYYDQIIQNNPKLSAFENGWDNRIANLRSSVSELNRDPSQNQVAEAGISGKFHSARDGASPEAPAEPSGTEVSSPFKELADSDAGLRGPGGLA